MIRDFRSRLASDLRDFIRFKRALGFAYVRAELTLRSFDRFLVEHAPRRGPHAFARLLGGWLGRIPGRRAITIALDLAVIREFFRFRRRCDPDGFLPGREWAPQPVVSHFVPRVLTRTEIKALLAAATDFSGDPIRRKSVRVAVLILYCTGLRPGEVGRLHVNDIDLRRRVMTIRETKGRTRLVPFREDLGRELAAYLRRRPRGSAREFLIRSDGRAWGTRAVCDTLRVLLRQVGVKPANGRVGARPYDLRHTFAVHRLTLWYRSGVDLTARLPWLSAYLGHDDLLGTETYLTVTPELLGIAGRRFATLARRSGPKA